MQKSNLIEVKTQTEVLYTLRVLTNNIDDLLTEIAALAHNNKKQLQHAPVILEIEDKHLQANDLAVLIEILTQNDMVAVGIRSQIKELIDFAKFSGLAVFGKPLTPIKSKKSDRKYTEDKTQNLHQDKVYHASKIVSTIVDSLMQIVSVESNLLLLEDVRAGSVVTSYGSISAYKEVQGSVFAGIKGNQNAIIYIHSFKARFVSIAGIQKQFDRIPAKFYARPIIIYLVDGKLRFCTTGRFNHL